MNCVRIAHHALEARKKNLSMVKKVRMLASLNAFICHKKSGAGRRQKLPPNSKWPFLGNDPPSSSHPEEIQWARSLPRNTGRGDESCRSSRSWTLTSRRSVCDSRNAFREINGSLQGLVSRSGARILQVQWCWSWFV